MSELDRIERQIDIDADAEKVWDLITVPGWYVNNGVIIDHHMEHDGDVTVVHDPIHGEFRFSTVSLSPHSYAAFRWLGDDESTLVEFFIDERGEGVTLRVVESGFESLKISDSERRAKLDQNIEGWEMELAAARAHLDITVTTRAIHVAVGPDVVWPFLADPEKFTTWCVVDQGPVVTSEQPTTFAYRVNGKPDSVLVTIALTDQGDGTLVTVTDPAATGAGLWESSLLALADLLPAPVAQR